MKKTPDIPLELLEIEEHVEKPHKHSWLFNMLIGLGFVVVFLTSVLFYYYNKDKGGKKEETGKLTPVERTQDPVERSQAADIPKSQTKVHAFDTITKWNIDPGFQAIYEVSAIDDLSTQIERKYRIRIIIPKEEKSIDIINKNIQDLIIKFIRSYGTQFPQDKVRVLQIWVYGVGNDVNLNYTVAEAIFAPEGSMNSSGLFTSYDDNMLLIKYKDEFDGIASSQ